MLINFVQEAHVFLKAVINALNLRLKAIQ